MKSKTQTARELNIELIKRYRAGDGEAGEELAGINQALVYSIAERFAHSADELSELCECGNIGLVKAINSFDFEFGCAFSTYAVPLIFGEIRRFLRDDGIIKVSREQKRLSATINAERERRLSLGEDVRISTLAEAVGVSVQDAAAALFSSAPVRSLDEAAYDDTESKSTIADTVFDEDDEARSFDRLAIKMSLEKLSEFHRRIITLRYFRDFSQMETARLLGITQVKVSREEKKILAIMKRDLT